MQSAATPLKFNLKAFEGPLDLLLRLIESNELEVFEIALNEVMDQYKGYLKTLMEHDLDVSAEFVGIVSSLMLLKSKMLLPKHTEDEVIDEGSLRLDIIEHLLHYYKFKNIAEQLRVKEQTQQEHFSRGFQLQNALLGPKELKKPKTDSLLSELFIQVLERKKLLSIQTIDEESYRVRDMMTYLKNLLKEKFRLSFHELFDIKESKLKLITLFLALLELMKNGIAQVVSEGEDLIIEEAQ